MDKGARGRLCQIVVIRACNNRGVLLRLVVVKRSISRAYTETLECRQPRNVAFRERSRYRSLRAGVRPLLSRSSMA
jgi:hypothetical protein